MAEAVEADVAAWIDAYAQPRDHDGRRQVVRNGHLPWRTILTGRGDVQVKQPHVRRRRSPEARVRFTSAILPPYPKRTKSLDELIR